jgi:large subunit ribosomal protein L22
MAQDTVAETLERPREHRENRKKNRGRKVEANQAQAIAKFIRVPPRKARLVMDAVRGRYAQDALAFLRFIPNRAAGYISKVLASAVANAANNHNLDPNLLKLVEARVDEGPRMKRVQPRAQGRAYRILKRMSHITVIVQESEPKPKKPKKAAATRTPAARTAKPKASAPAAKAEKTKPAVAAEETTPVVPVAETPTETTTPVETPVVAETAVETPVVAETKAAKHAEATDTAETK